jgi:hypothetical protein
MASTPNDGSVFGFDAEQDADHPTVFHHNSIYRRNKLTAHKLELRRTSGFPDASSARELITLVSK